MSGLSREELSAKLYQHLGSAGLVDTVKVILLMHKGLWLVILGRGGTQAQLRLHLVQRLRQLDPSKPSAPKSQKARETILSRCVSEHFLAAVSY